MAGTLSLSAAFPVSSSSSPRLSSSVSQSHNHPFIVIHAQLRSETRTLNVTGRGNPPVRAFAVGGCATSEPADKILRTCKNCKTQFDPLLNHPRACRFHTAHFGGETKRKFESVYSGGTMNTPDSGKVYQYWHCCGSEDPFDPGCTAAPHASYDD